MSYRCLADFLEELRPTGEMIRVEAPVNPVLEAAEMTRRIATTGGPAILLGSVSGHEMPVLTNLLGTEARICRALRVDSVEQIARRIESMVDPTEPDGWFDRLKTAPHIAQLSKVRPRTVKSGAVQQVVRLGGDVDLNELPLLRSAPDESAGSMTAAILFSADPDSHTPVAGSHVVGRHDLRLLGPDRLAVDWADYDPTAQLLAEYGRKNEKMPVAAVLGGDPAILLAASAMLPPAVDALALAGLLREKPLDLVGCRTTDLMVPAEAEIVVEGFIDPQEPPVEVGPMVSPSGHYGHTRPLPVLHVTAVTHRVNPVFPAMVHGRPPNEACIIRRALVRMFRPLVKMAIPELIDYDLPMYGAARHWAILSIRKTHAGQARRVAHAAWGLPALTFSKILVMVDEEIDVHDTSAVLAAISTNVNPGRDLIVQQGPPDPHDIATPWGTLGHKMAIDATAKLPAEHQGTWSKPAEMSEEIRRLVDERWGEYGLDGDKM